MSLLGSLRFRRFVVLLLGLCVVSSVVAGCHRHHRQRRERVVATEPVARMEDWWQAKFAEHRALASSPRGRDFQLVFIGDSITEAMRGVPELMNKYWGQYHPQEFGISGDATSHVLWRLRNGELDGVSPKVAVLLIGTNNLLDNSDEQVFDGIKLIVSELRARMPNTKLLVLGLLPRGAFKDNPYRKRVTGVNALLSRSIADGKHVFYLDVAEAFLEPNMVLKLAYMPDQLHPSGPGYEAMYEAMKPTVDKLMAE